MTRIHIIECKFKEATDWLGHTDQGTIDEGHIRDCVLKRCLYFYELEPIMVERLSIKPLWTATDMRPEDFPMISRKSSKLKGKICAIMLR